MALFTKNLLLRVLTALVGAPLIIFLALWEKAWGWKALILLATILALIEYGQMAFKKEEFVPKYVTLVVGSLFAAFLLSVFKFQPYLLLFAPWAVVMLLISLVLMPGDIKESGINAGKGLMGVFYIAQLAAFIGLMKDLPHGGRWIIFTLTIVWLNDTGAYFVGKSMGKHKFSPVVSPNKTWEGAIGGTFASCLAGVGATFYVPGLTIPVAIILAVFVGTFGQLGDLAESLLKRSFGVKDSGNLLPGHGGILDRIDALLFAFPIMFGYLYIAAYRSLTSLT
ncbi:phosphatidate cytidylyltransferase [Myxococcota bacterium]|nr:phosphatidate cytidylyltransferase [Myxococcota bacterium]